MGEALERDGELAMLLEAVATAEGAERAEALLGAGHRMLELGRAEEALAAVTAARDIFEAAELSGPLTMCEHNTAVVLAALGRVDEALDRHRSAVELHTERFEPLEAARCVVHVADLLRIMGRHDDALAQYEAAAAALDAEGPDEAGACRLQRTELLVELDRFEEAAGALMALRPALTGCVSCVARWAEQTADTLAGMQRFTEALAAAEEAVALWDACGVDVRVTACDLRVASLMARCDRAEAAIDRLEELREAFRAEGDAVAVARCDDATAVALDALGHEEDAQRLPRRSEVVLDAAGMAA